MKAVPIIPGKAYRVTGNGRDITIMASNGVEAILLVVRGRA